MDRERSPVPGSPARGTVELRLADLGHGSRTVLRRIDAVAPEGTHVLIIGDNGSGKSTLLATVAGLLPKQAGHVLVHGHDPLHARREVHRHTGHLGHQDPFYPELTGRENLAFQARLRGLAPATVAEGLAAVGLRADADRLVADYSHGMRRRLGLAKAVLGDPRLVLLDEPESGLDAGGRRAFHTGLGHQPGRTVLLSTHHWNDWLEWADRGWVLGSGGLIVVALEGDKEQRRVRIERALAGRGGTA